MFCYTIKTLGFEDEISLTKICSRILKKYTPGKLTVLSTLEELLGLFLLKEVKPSPDRKVIKRPAKTRSKMTTAITLSRHDMRLRARAEEKSF